MKGFARFIQRQETAKAFASWLEICTKIPKPEEAAKPPLQSICDKLSHGDAHAVTHFLSISDEALRQTMEDYPESFLEAFNRDPNTSLDREARTGLHEKYLKNFCAALENLLALDKEKSSPQSLAIRLEQAHHTAMCTVIKPPPNPFDNNLVFSHLQKLIGEGTERKLKEEAQAEQDRQPNQLTATQNIAQVPAQAIAEDPKEANRAIYRGFEMECDLSYKNTKSFLVRVWEGAIKRLPVIRDWRRLRPSTKKPKPRDIGDLSNVSIAADRTHWEAKVKHAPDIIERFVQDFDWNYPALWPELKQCEIDHLAKIIAMPADIAILDLLPQSVSQSSAIDSQHAQPSEFSSGFLNALRSLESEIDASIYGIQFTRDMTKPELKPASNLAVIEPELEQALDPEVTRQETKDHFNPKVTKVELRSAQIRRWGKPALTKAQKLEVGKRPNNSESPVSTPGPYKDFQDLRMKSLDHFMRLAMNDLEALVNPDKFPQTITQALGNFVNSYVDHFAFRLARNPVGDPNKYTSADLSNAHAFSMRQAVDAAVLSAVSRKVILPANAPEYERQLNVMCRQIDFAIMRATGELKPASATR